MSDQLKSRRRRGPQYSVEEVTAMSEEKTPQDPDERLAPMSLTREQRQEMYRLLVEHPGASLEVKRWAQSKIRGEGPRDEVRWHTPGPWRWTNVDYDYEDRRSGFFRRFAEDENGPFEALWSDHTNSPVMVAEDGSSYMARVIIPNAHDRRYITAVPELVEQRDELLAALEGALPLLRRLIESLGCHDARHFAAVESAEAAVRRARRGLLRIDPDKVSGIGQQELEVEVAALLADPSFLRMTEDERRANDYPVAREEMIELLRDRWEEDREDSATPLRGRLYFKEKEESEE